MDQPQSAKEPDSAQITLTPDMRPLGSDPVTTRGDEKQTRGPKAVPSRRSGRWAVMIGAAGLVVGALSLGVAAWTYSEGQREILRLSTELAQLRVSLDLYARNGSGASDLSAFEERLSALETTARTAAVPMPQAEPAPVAGAAQPTASAQNEDCLPVGMRLLVAAGDTYPICEQPAAVAVSFVDNGYITLSDGTSVASGGTTPLPGNAACTISVTSGGDEGLTGYAEIRVNC